MKPLPVSHARVMPKPARPSCHDAPQVPPLFLEMLQQAISGEASAVEFYTMLLAMAPSDFARDQVAHALADEKKHLANFSAVYHRLTGLQPRPEVSVPAFDTFLAGIEYAIIDELEAYEMYRDMLLMVSDQWIRDIMFDALTDEMEHAVRFTNLAAMLR